MRQLLEKRGKINLNKMDLKETDEGTWKQTSVSNGPIWYHMPHFQLFWASEGSLSSKSDIQLIGVLDT